MIDGKPRYRNLNALLQGFFGEKVQKVSLSAGFTCPNRDGTRGRGGCTFCNPASWEALGLVKGSSIPRQIREGIEYVRERHKVGKFLAYFNDYTNTYDGVERLERIYRQALDEPEVVGLVVSTRPDCLPPDVLDLLERLSRETFLWVEVGIQTAHDSTLERVNRCHTVEDSRRAIEALLRRHVAVSVHVILGLPGESAGDMFETARSVTESGVYGVKIHNLHIVKDTILSAQYRKGEVQLLELEEYVDVVVGFLERLPPHLVIQRMTAQSPRRLTIAPEWSVNKWVVVNAIHRALETRDTWQGKALGGLREELERPLELPALRICAR
ncbi:MAG: TIGR01212 family radical SAM protein [Armatimonadetes bacterium]|nr:TIGR01212 family radical SAM protein [Armatimonadota bacterium]